MHTLGLIVIVISGAALVFYLGWLLSQPRPEEPDVDGAAQSMGIIFPMFVAASIGMLMMTQPAPAPDRVAAKQEEVGEVGVPDPDTIQNCVAIDDDTFQSPKERGDGQ